MHAPSGASNWSLRRLFVNSERLLPDQCVVVDCAGGANAEPDLSGSGWPCLFVLASGSCLLRRDLRRPPDLRASASATAMVANDSMMSLTSAGIASDSRGGTASSSTPQTRWIATVSAAPKARMAHRWWLLICRRRIMTSAITAVAVSHPPKAQLLR